MSIFYLFDFPSLWSPFFGLSLIIVFIGYYFLTIKYRLLFKRSTPVQKSQVLSFITFLIILYIIKGSPIDLLSHMMLTFHMVQMGFLLLVLPILFIKGIPFWFWQTILNRPFLKVVLKLFTRPIAAMLFFNVAFSLYHIPMILDFSKTSTMYHTSIHSILFVLATFMYWPILGVYKKGYDMSGLLKTGYMFANGALMLPACALIIFSSTPLYSTYSEPESWVNALSLCASPSSISNLGVLGPELIELFNPLGLIQDQQLGGIIMKGIQEIIYGILIAKVFLDWYREDQAYAAVETKKYMAQYYKNETD